MATADRISLRDLRKLAREALGDGATVGEHYYDGWHCFAKSKVRGDGEVSTWGPQQAARRQLRDLLQLIVMGRAAAKAIADALDAKERAPRRRATNGAGYRRKTT